MITLDNGIQNGCGEANVERKQQQHQHQQQQHYPFAAVVGQDDLKLCLILNAIDPTIGGVLIRGDKGTAKSTAARGLAKLLPPISVAYNPASGALDPYNRPPPSKTQQQHDDDDDDDVASDQQQQDANADASFRTIPTPFVDLPLGATEDRVLGSIDVSATLRSGGKPSFAPGLLAAANRGILYIDEVNLLPAHLVDVLLDACASGVNTLQREGLSVRHPARFVLVGTMNPEEGDLRPQLVDRFGLACDVVAPREPGVRSSVVKRRIAFEADPSEFAGDWEGRDDELRERIEAARALLPSVGVSERWIDAASTICVEFGVSSLRADIALYKTAAALAAWERRTNVESGDVKRAAGWVLAHRKQRHAFDNAPRPPPPKEDRPSPEDDRMDEILNAPPPPPKTNSNDEGGDDSDQPNEEKDQNPQQPEEESEGDRDCEQDPRNDQDENSDGNNDDDEGDDGNDEDRTLQTFTASKPEQIKQLRLEQQHMRGRSGSGRHKESSRSRGHYVRSVPTETPVDLALDATLRSAAVNGLDPDTGMPIVRPENYRRKVRQSATDTLVLFVVDASGSMAARKRMETVKGAVLALLTDAYQQRDRVGVVTFRGVGAEVLLPPTRSVERAEEKLRRLSTGGRTPLAHALLLAHQTIDRDRRNANANEPDQHSQSTPVLLILVSDGKANVPLPRGDRGDVQGNDVWSQTVQQAEKLASLAVPTLFLDTDAGHVRVGRGKELAELLGADYLRLEELSADGLVHTIRQAKKR
eukprot:jgi/Psemu1/318629/estExt_fgenesh1_pm.C_1000009